MMYLSLKEPKWLKRLFSIIGILCCVTLSNAQNYYISDGLNVKSDYAYEIIGKLKDHYLLFRDKYTEFEVQAYDTNMKESWSKEIELETKGTQVLGVASAKNDFSIIYKTKKKGDVHLRVCKYDPGASMIDSLTLQVIPSNFLSSPEFEFVGSEDKNIFAIIQIMPEDRADIIAFALDKMKVLWHKEVEMKLLNLDKENRKGKIVLSNQAELFLMHVENTKRSKLEEQFLDVHEINAQGENHINVPLSPFQIVDMRFKMDQTNRQLVGGGLFSEKNNDKVNGCLFIKMQVGNRQNDLKYTNFDEKFTSVITGKDVSDPAKGFTDGLLRDIVLRNDGGIILIGERAKVVERGLVAGRSGLWREAPRVIVDFYHDDIFVIAAEPNGKIQFKTILHKRQFSQDDNGIFSSFFTMRNSDKLRFLFNDEIKYDNTCSEYQLSPLGGFDRNAILNTQDKRVRLRFRDAVQVASNAVVVPSEFRNKLKLVLFVL